MKKVLLVIIVFAIFANAQIMLESINCNKATNPEKSCQLGFSRFSFGQNFGTGGTNMFFFDVSGLSISKNVLPNAVNVPPNQGSPTLPIRFFILSSEAGYNSAMSLIHTAYASRASLSVIFMNPLDGLFKDEQSFVANYPTQRCYVNRINNEPISILCPIMAITLEEN